MKVEVKVCYDINKADLVVSDSVGHVIEDDSPSVVECASSFQLFVAFTSILRIEVLAQYNLQSGSRLMNIEIRDHPDGINLRIS